jgi:7-cyano-7-deazaguanine synthase in queuosine biosynthesis
MPDVVKKVVLAYSGGLDTSVILRWLQETYHCKVVTFIGKRVGRLEFTRFFCQTNWNEQILVTRPRSVP